jgi:CelD/BcsL family acetyltransferase involved in cellulose biosynthesis
MSHSSVQEVSSMACQTSLKQGLIDTMRVPVIQGAVPRQAPVRVRYLRLQDLTPRDIAAWHDLEAQALEPNPNLSPHFMLSVMRHLDPQGHIVLAVVEAVTAGRSEFCALVPLQMAPGNRFMPLPHYRVQLSMHSFLTGLLVRRSDAQRHLEALFDQWHREACHGIVLEACHVDGPTNVLLRRIAEERGLQYSEVDGFDRAGMRPADMGEADLTARLPSRLKKLRAQKKKLEKFGAVSFKVWRGAEVTDQVIEHHLALEHMGWKGENGSSLRSKPAHEAFFRDMAQSFASDGRALFCELWVGDRVIASSSNLISGHAGAAFKIGFDPEFAAMAPGIACELELMRCAPEVLAGIDYVDSGSVAGSYIEDLWPLRHRVATITYATSLRGRLALQAGCNLRRVKRVWRERSPITARQATGSAIAVSTVALGGLFYLLG